MEIILIAIKKIRDEPGPMKKKENHACSEQLGQRHIIVNSFHAHIKKTLPVE